MLTEAEVYAVLEKLSEATASQNFDQVAPLLAEDAIYRFTDGDFVGIDAIRAAFEQTWANYPDDRWEICNVRVVSLDAASAVVTYDTLWTATVDGQQRSSVGRGTNVIARKDGALKIVFEHLSH